MFPFLFSLPRFNYSTQTQLPIKTLAYLSIGGELLNGSVQDIHLQWLAKFAYPQGFEISTMRVIPDDEATIIQSIQDLSKSADHVITTGGIGPTHDDITYESIAKAQNKSLEYHQETLDLMAEFMRKSSANPDKPFILNQPRKRMALFPQDSKIYKPAPDLWVPVVQSDNVSIYPGVPRLFQKMILFGSFHIFSQEPTQNRFRQVVRTGVREGDLTDSVTRIQNKYIEDIVIGVYPKNDSVHIVLDGFDENQLIQVKEEIEAELPHLEIIQNRLRGN